MSEQELNDQPAPQLTRLQADAEWERLVAELQREIDRDAAATYSATVLEQARHPHNLGRIESPDGQAVLTGWCGDTMEIYLRLNGSAIEQATFMTDGCGPSVASGNMLTTLVRGMTLDEAAQITPPELLRALDGLPEESAHCAELAVNTLRQAIAQVRGQDLAGADRPAAPEPRQEETGS